MSATYDLQTAGLPPLNQAVTDIDGALTTLDSLGIVSVPAWLLQLFGVLTSFDAVFSQLQVSSTLVLAAEVDGGYLATETWNSVQAFDPSGNPVVLSAGQVTLRGPDPYPVDVCSPTALYRSHAIGGALAGLVTPLLDAVIAVGSGQSGAPHFDTLAELLAYVFGSLCGSLPDFALQALCNGYLGASLQGEVTQAVAQIAASVSVAEVSGAATVESATLQDHGTWSGSDGAGTFSGSFSCTEP